VIVPATGTTTGQNGVPLISIQTPSLKTPLGTIVLRDVDLKPGDIETIARAIDNWIRQLLLSGFDISSLTPEQANSLLQNAVQNAVVQSAASGTTPSQAVIQQAITGLANTGAALSANTPSETSGVLQKALADVGAVDGGKGDGTVRVALETFIRP
jgi:hypothetical protein